MKRRSNEEWLSSLRAEGELRDFAISDLQMILTKGLPNALTKRLDRSDPRFASLIEETVQDTILRVIDKLDTFEGRSKFTTWVFAIAVRILLSELRKAKWREVSLDEMLETKENTAGLFPHQGKSASLEENLQQEEGMEVLKKAIGEVLTDKQRTALIAAAVNDIPLEEVARKMGTNRNALYKLLHDARLRLKSYLIEKDFSHDH